jgi:hypothetical protein
MPTLNPPPPEYLDRAARRDARVAAAAERHAAARAAALALLLSTVDRYVAEGRSWKAFQDNHKHRWATNPRLRRACRRRWLRRKSL